MSEVVRDVEIEQFVKGERVYIDSAAPALKGRLAVVFDEKLRERDGTLTAVGSYWIVGAPPWILLGIESWPGSDRRELALVDVTQIRKERRGVG